MASVLVLEDVEVEGQMLLASERDLSWSEDYPKLEDLDNVPVQ